MPATVLNKLFLRQSLTIFHLLSPLLHFVILTQATNKIFCTLLKFHAIFTYIQFLIQCIIMIHLPKKSFLNIYTNNAIFIAFNYLLFHNFLYTPELQDHLAVTFLDTFWPHLK